MKIHFRIVALEKYLFSSDVHIVLFGSNILTGVNYYSSNFNLRIIEHLLILNHTFLS